MKTYRYEGKIVDVIKRRIFNGALLVEDNCIVEIEEIASANYCNYLIPGFIDSHIHIESSMLIPSSFAKLAVRSGTVAVIADPHEIANVLGESGVEYMIHDGKRVPFKFYFGVPSCVPATEFETSGECLDSKAVEEMINKDDMYFLGEMMNFPGIINNDAESIKKVKQTLAINKVVDGHAPGLRGKDLQTYAATGITTDHECADMDEALEKIHNGMDIIIREGSAARNFETLIGLMDNHSDKLMFCSDDKHPDGLMVGHINLLAQRAIANGYNIFDVLRACSMNTINHYSIDVGLLQKGDKADFIRVDNLNDLNVLTTYIDGRQVYDINEGFCEEFVNLSQPANRCYPNKMYARKLSADSLKIQDKGTNIHVICASDGSLVTTDMITKPKITDDCAVADVERDILKLVVYNRYTESKPQTAFIHGLNLKRGAIASTIAHDSHNIIAAGTNDEDLYSTINMLIDCGGGIAAGTGNRMELLPLPIAGLMSPEDAEDVAYRYRHLNHVVAKLGSPLKAPFMTLSFMALLVIPELKLSDKGLFDSNKMSFTPLFVE